jgi:hypothetical protein
MARSMATLQAATHGVNYHCGQYAAVPKAADITLSLREQVVTEVLEALHALQIGWTPGSLQCL